MKTLTTDGTVRGLQGFKGAALTLLMTMTLTWAREMDSAMAEQFQRLLDARGKSLNGAGMIMAVRIPGRDLWVGATGYAQRGGEVLTDAKPQPLLDQYGLRLRASPGSRHRRCQGSDRGRHQDGGPPAPPTLWRTPAD